MAPRITILTSEQRDYFRGIPPDFSDREIARYYTFTPHDVAVIKLIKRVPVSFLQPLRTDTDYAMVRD